MRCLSLTRPDALRRSSTRKGIAPEMGESLRGRWSLISSKTTRRSRVVMYDCVTGGSSPKRRWPRDLASRRERFGHGPAMACSMHIRIRTEANACTNHQENSRRGNCKVQSLPIDVYYRSFIATTEGDAV